MSRWAMVVDIEPVIDPSVPALRLQPGVKRAITGRPYRANANAAGGTGPYTYSADNNLPDWASIDPDTGEITGTPTGGPAYTEVELSVEDALGNVVPTLVAIEVVDSIVIGGVLAPAEDSIAYSSGLTVTGATGAVTWGMTGVIPGLTIDSGTGILSGTPTTPGTYAITIDATDSVGETTSRALKFEVAAMLTLVPPIMNWYIFAGAYFEAQLETTGGVGPMVYSVNDATPLPDGLHLNPTTGVIYGTPTTQGVSPVVTLYATDFLGAVSGVSQVLRIISPIDDMARNCIRNFTGNGSATTFTVTHDFPVGFDFGVSLFLIISGGPRRPVTADFEYTIADADVDFTFKSAPPNTHTFVVVMTGSVTS